MHSNRICMVDVDNDNEGGQASKDKDQIEQLPSLLEKRQEDQENCAAGLQHIS